MDIIKAKKKPIIIPGFQFDLKEAEKIINHKPKSKNKEGCVTILGVLMSYKSYKTDVNASFIIDTLEGPHIVSDKDWIMTGVEGEHYPIKKDIFKKTYDIVSD